MYPNLERDQSIIFEFGFDYKTPFSFNKTAISIQSKPTQTCIVNLYLPVGGVPLPFFNIYMSGIQDNISIDDTNMNGISLNFTRGMIIRGETAIVSLKNHYIYNMTVNLKFGVLKLHAISSKIKNVYITTGLYNEELNPN